MELQSLAEKREQDTRKVVLFKKALRAYALLGCYIINHVFRQRELPRGLIATLLMHLNKVPLLRYLFPLLIQHFKQAIPFSPDALHIPEQRTVLLLNVLPLLCLLELGHVSSLQRGLKLWDLRAGLIESELQRISTSGFACKQLLNIGDRSVGHRERSGSLNGFDFASSHFLNPSGGQAFSAGYKNNAAPEAEQLLPPQPQPS